jgi:hypothetical protein
MEQIRAVVGNERIADQRVYARIDRALGAEPIAGM